MNNQVIYIAGSISLFNDTAQVRFDESEKYLKSLGYITINPMRLYPKGLKRECYMDISFAYIRASNAMYMLKHWDIAQGSLAEHHYALQIEKKNNIFKKTLKVSPRRAI